MLKHGLLLLLAWSAQAKDLNFHFPKTNSPQRFDIKVNQDFLDFTLRKVRDYRPANSFFSDWTNEGPPKDAVKDLAEYWGSKYNWREVEKSINKDYKHYATTVPGNGNYSAPIPIHFVHERSKNSKATPLLLLHGWSSTHLEWRKVFPKLSKNFHVVAIDLPGYGFSPAPTKPGLGAKEQAIAFDALMQQLGYKKYGVVSTDLGWVYGSAMTEYVGENIIGHFTDFFLAQPTQEILARAEQGKTTQEENEYLAGLNEFSTKHFAYASVQSQKPGLLAGILSDSPVGTAAWLWDLKEGSSDGVEPTQEEVVTDGFVTWIQDTYGSIRSYSIGEAAIPTTKISNVPTAVTTWGNENGRFPGLRKFPLTPKSWLEPLVNLVYYKKHAGGGHYPAWTKPDDWTADVKEFFFSL
ncbi:related to epoxide hydrolase [Fusarium oxysporum]|uniref:Related to epoxide hydrolase n=1 Tax=Fusarium oxysporum TaxID=5507 RepID=A0A2H3U5T7_FUSOX|nr:related to epoxide hydrolase [Fusarium oxysporum]